MQHVGLFLAPGFSLLALGCVLEPLRIINEFARAPLCQWSILSADGQNVPSDSGLTVTAQRPAWQATDCSLILLLAGAAAATSPDPGLRDCLSNLSRYVSRLGGVGEAVIPLARAGLLNGYRCAVSPYLAQRIIREFPRIDVVTYELSCIDRNRLTCVGGSAVTHLMLAIIAEQHGVAMAADVADELLRLELYAPRATGPDLLGPGRFETLDRRLAGAVTLMKQNLAQPLSIRTVAIRVGASERELERLFHWEFGCSPSRFSLGLRLNHARRLVIQSTEPILEVAHSCGFSDASHLTKWYRRMFHETPARERRRRHATRHTAGPAGTGH